jgi:hypothetical protein
MVKAAVKSPPSLYQTFNLEKGAESRTEGNYQPGDNSKSNCRQYDWQKSLMLSTRSLDG